MSYTTCSPPYQIFSCCDETITLEIHIIVTMNFVTICLDRKKINLILFFFTEPEIQSRDWSKHSYPNDILSGYKMASSKFSRNMSASRQNVHLLLVACSVFMLLMLSSMLPQTRAVLSGTGGVFNSPEAQEYWNRRYKLMSFYLLTLLLHFLIPFICYYQFS